MQTFEQIIKDIDKKIYKPIYFLMGEEAYYIDEITKRLEKEILPEAEQMFNQTVLYGKDIDIGVLLNAARKYPMMSNYNVIVVREAQEMKGIDGIGGSQVDPFLLYAENPSEKTIMIINYRGKSLKKNKKLYKVLDKTAALFESKKLYDNQVAGWVTNYVKNKGYTIDPQSSELMASHIGSDLSKIANELGKLAIVLPVGTAINSKIIEDNIGISKEFNVFELQKAIGRRDSYQVNLIVKHLGQNPKTKSIIPIISNLYGYFTKVFMVHYSEDKSNNSVASLIGVNPFFVGDYLLASRNYPKVKCAAVISILREYDIKSKGINSPSVDDTELMREMMFKILQ